MVLFHSKDSLTTENTPSDIRLKTLDQRLKKTRKWDFSETENMKMFLTDENGNYENNTFI
jgi:hypothetical protein